MAPSQVRESVLGHPRTNGLVVECVQTVRGPRATSLERGPPTAQTARRRSGAVPLVGGGGEILLQDGGKTACGGVERAGSRAHTASPIRLTVSPPRGASPVAEQA